MTFATLRLVYSFGPKPPEMSTIAHCRLFLIQTYTKAVAGFEANQWTTHLGDQGNRTAIKAWKNA